MSGFIVAYDIMEAKRRTKVAKLVYGYALGGQKSVLEMPIDAKEMKHLAHVIDGKIDSDTDKVNIIKVEDAILLGIASHLEYDNGMVLL